MSHDDLHRIVSFIKKHHVMTLATCKDGAPWCCNLFYAYIADKNLFVVTSDLSTRHACQALSNENIAGSVVLETRTVGKVQGLQFEGICKQGSPAELAMLRSAYIKRFPYAAVAPLELWLIQPTLMKLTDNTLGFGKKIIWRRED